MGILAVLQATAEWEVVTVPPWLHNLPVQIALWNQHARQRGNNIRSDSTISKKWIAKRLWFNVRQKKKVNWKSLAGIKWELTFLLIVMKNVIITLRKINLFGTCKGNLAIFSNKKLVDKIRIDISIIVLHIYAYVFSCRRLSAIVIIIIIPCIVMLHFTFSHNALLQGQKIQFTCIWRF